MTINHRIRPLVLVLTLTLSLMGCADKSPESHIEEAKLALKKSDYKAAVLELKNALQSAPANTEARLLLGQAFQFIGQWANSEKELRKAMEQGAPAEQVLPMLAKALVKTGKYQAMIDLAIPKAGLSSLALAAIQAERATAFMSLNKPTEAVAAIDQGGKVLAAVGGNAYSNDLQLAKVRMAFLNQQPTQALALLEGALQRDAKSTDALYMKAQLLLGEGKAPEALKVYEQITAARPDEIMAHLAIADLKLSVNDMAAAEKALQAAEKVDANNLSVKYTRAKVSHSKGDLNKANEALQQVLRIAPDHLPSLLLNAAVSYGLGNYEQSLKNANRVLGQMPGHLPAAKLVAANELGRGNAKAAMDVLQPLAQAHPQDIGLLSMLGETNLQLGQYDKAAVYLDRAAALQPKDAAIKQRQARVHLAQGQADLAVRELEEAARLSDKAARGDLTLITLHMGRKEFDKALQAIATLDKKLPNNPVTSYLRGLALSGKNDRAGARKAFEQAIALRPDFFLAAANLAHLDMAENKPDTARQRFTAILESNAKNTQAMMALAALAEANKANKEALDWLEKAAKADPKAIPPRGELVRYYLADKKPQQALAVAREAASANPDSASALGLLGTAQMAAGDKLGALSTFSKASEKAPKSAEAFYELGAAQVVSNRVREGRASFDKALALQPGHVGALDSLLLLDVADRKLERALQRVRAFQAQNPKSPAGFEREGDILFGQKQYVQSAKAYERGLGLGLDLQVFGKMLGALAQSGNQKLADQKLTDLLARFPGDVQVQSFAADYFMSVGRNAESLRLYEGLRQTQPNNPAFLNNSALLYQRLKDGRAVQTAEQALKLAPDNANFMDTLGWILVEQGQAAKAVDLLKQASAKAPKSSSIRYHLAVALARAGNKADAKRELAALLKTGRDFPEAEEARKLAASL